MKPTVQRRIRIISTVIFPALFWAGVLVSGTARTAEAIFVPCGDANADGAVTTIDSLAALRSSVGLNSPCDRNCDCDTDADRDMTTTDALEILQSAVDGDEAHGCGFYDYCFNDDDCEDGDSCDTDPDWECDAACVP